MKVTGNELAVLAAIDASEYGDCIRDEVWTFTIADNSSLTPTSIPGIVASLNKKGLTRSGGRGTDATIGMTDAGVEVYVTHVGRANTHKWMDDAHLAELQAARDAVK